MISPLPSYFSLRYESEVEKEYIVGLVGQFENAKITDSYHLALFAYHLLFMSFVYQTVHKIKKWMPDRFCDALIQSSAEKKKEYFEARSPWVFSEIRESSVFEFLNLLQICNGEVKKCKNIIKQRNKGFGHATGVLVSEEEFERKVNEYDQIAQEIHKLTHAELAKIFDEYIADIDQNEEVIKDDIELNLIIPNRLSDQDLEKLAAECLIKPTLQKEKISKIIQDDFGVFVEIIK
ncbi:MAG: hypothetical protein WA055_02180 [Candidatus Moraniibacteriota bacterium]